MSKKTREKLYLMYSVISGVFYNAVYKVCAKTNARKYCCIEFCPESVSGKVESVFMPY